MLLFYINSILMFYPKICFRKQVQDKDILQVKGYIKAQEYADAVFIPYKTPEARNYAIFNDIRNAVCVSDDRPMIDLGMRVQYTITDKNEGVIINETIDAASCR